MSGLLLALVELVNPFVGTAGYGHTTPAASCPFGMVQPGPDTGNFAWKYCGGYQYDDRTLIGFSQTHLSGTGAADFGDVRILPYIGGDAAPAAQVKVCGEGEQQMFKVFTKGLLMENKSVRSVTLNGDPITDWKVCHKDIVKGGELVFGM